MENLVLSRRLYEKVFNKQIDIKVKSGEQSYRANCELCMSMNVLYVNDFDVEFVQPAPRWGNYFDVRKGEVSYTQKGVPEKNDEGKWKRASRLVIKPSKLVKYLISCNRLTVAPPTGDKEVFKKIENRFLELVSNNLKTNDFAKIQVSDDPCRIYELPTDTHSGTLANSCMRAESDYSCGNYSSFYNAMGTKIAYILNDEGDLSARALIWEDCEGPDGNSFTFVDRIYGNEETIEAFKEWAHHHGYAHKVEQSYENSELKFPDGSTIEDYAYRRIANYSNEGVPFADTLCNLTINDDEYILSPQGGDYSMQNCGGELDLDDGMEECAGCGARIDIEFEPFYEINGGLYCEECAVYSERIDQPILRAEAVLSEYYSDWIPRDDALFIADIDDWVSDDDPDLVEINGLYYLIGQSDIEQCSYCGEWFLGDEVKYSPELGENLCEDCLETRMKDEGYEFINGEWINNQLEIKFQENECK